MFVLQPKGQHECLVCLGTACYIKGGAKLLVMAEALTQVRAGKTMPDGQVSLTTARCIGACG
jgi:bidirectional [NiFe] hydrogenase diaphorase subunit